MTKLSDYYAVVLTSKWFYLSILLTIVSYLVVGQGMENYAHDYFQFGSVIASFDFPVLRFFFLTFRYSIVLTEISILCWHWYTPVEAARFPDTLPAGMTWDQMYMKFTDDEHLLVIAGQYRRTLSYIEMGFVDNRGKQPQPNVAWNFLKVLALKNGELAFPDPDAKGTYKKQKQLLADALEEYFRIDFDPFQSYRSEKAYKVKMTLMASDEMRAAALLKLKKQEAVVNEIQVEHTKQTPSVHKGKTTTEDWLDGEELNRETW